MKQLLIALSALTLAACNAGGTPQPDISNTTSSPSCAELQSGESCSISFMYNNYGQTISLRSTTVATLPTLSECQATPQNGCGIIYDGSFDQSLGACIDSFQSNTGSGECDITFNYTSGVSGSGTNWVLAFVNTADGVSTQPVDVVGD